VVAVIINHFNKELLPSGYLGVDIFFVISGFVITSSLAGRQSGNFLDFMTGFYERRIKRLVPALVVFVLITSVLISLFNPEPETALDLGLRSLFGLSNIELYRASVDYFSYSTELNPFTHTWSLGVEEQFYLLFPFLIWFTGFGRQAAKGDRNLFVWVGLLTVFSIIGFIYLYRTNQPAAYFLMPSRFWEVAAGCMLFLGFKRRQIIEQSLEKVPPFLVVAAMLGVMFLPVKFAIPATIGMVALTCILIACLKDNTLAYGLFTHKDIVYIGLISYSLYLWHWGVLSISRWTLGIHWWTVPLQAGMILLLAIASYRWIETPARRRQYFSQRWKTLGGGVSVAGLASIPLILLSNDFADNLYLGRRPVPQSLKKYASFRSELNSCRIFEKLPTSDKIASECGILNSTALPTIYVVGDSHAFALGRYLNGLSRVSGAFNTVTLWGNACLFSGSIDSSYRHASQHGKNCRELQEQVVQLVKTKAREGDSLVIANATIDMFLPQSEFKFRDADGSPVSKTDAKGLYFREIRTIFSHLADVGGRVFFYVHPGRYDPIADPYLDCRNNSQWNSQWFDRLSKPARADKCLVPRGEIMERYRLGLLSEIDQLSRVFGEDVIIDAFSTGICDQKYCNGAFTTDGGHLQGWAVGFLANQIVERTGYLQ
jgi:peptidoglycan/LPS O-acetylase OafA/YrhL